jgi:hypothetical protein
MSVIRLRRWGLPLATALLVMASGLVMAPHAQANMPSRTEVSATSGLNSNNVKRIARDCPANLHVVGTGYQINGANGAVKVSALVPTPASAPTSVRLRAVAVDPFAGRWSVTVKAVCGDVATTVSAATTAFNSVNTKNKSADCSGLRVIGTGYSIDEPTSPNPVIGSIGMDSALTIVTIFANEADPDAARWSLTTLAICSPDLGQTLVTATEPPPPDSASPETVDAMCPAGTETAGAGFNTRGVGNVLADDFNPAPRLAETVAYEEDPYATNWTLSTDAVCV